VLQKKKTNSGQYVVHSKKPYVPNMDPWRTYDCYSIAWRDRLEARLPDIKAYVANEINILWVPRAVTLKSLLFYFYTILFEDA
jgi:hypothetical protein